MQYCYDNVINNTKIGLLETYMLRCRIRETGVYYRYSLDEHLIVVLCIVKYMTVSGGAVQLFDRLPTHTPMKGSISWIGQVARDPKISSHFQHSIQKSKMEITIQWAATIAGLNMWH